MRFSLKADLDDPRPACAAADSPDVREAAFRDAAEDEKVGCSCRLGNLLG
jgi:hypothetical protein